MTTDDLDLQYSDEEIRDFIGKAVAQASTHQQQPRFYAVTGSHVYGFESPNSDIDVRGVHVTPAEKYAYLQTPVDEVTVNMDGTTEGFEAYAEIDLRSYELKKFGSLLAKANYNVIELVFEAPTVMNGLSLEMDALEALIRKHLPMNVSHAYLGMAKSNYYKHLDPEKAKSYDPRPKKFLYVYRGLLGAQYVLGHEDIEANIHTLATEVDGGDPALVTDLIDHKREANDPFVSDALEERARTAIVEQFNALDALPKPQKVGYREEIDKWMHNVRI
ncbi:nucleotidyltransferase domain-containing protein [Halocatena marina]|uniref:nucleotidyltransferase domain-containing protein n=1 Tax=Halocatena marina TaxID=2934937 RepID=UPI00200DF05D|nr:nucleotidyltransferase domain-containing protein [Halocatena marina]